MKPEILSASLQPGTVDEKARTVDLIWYSGAAVRRYDWWKDEEYMLAFSMEPADVKLDRLNGGAPLLNAHWSYSMSDQIGVVENARIENGKGLATVRFSEREDVEPIFQDVKAGVFRNISMGASVYQTRDVTPKGEKTRQLLAIDWEPLEISMVPIGADPGAGFLSAVESPEAIARFKQFLTRVRGEEPAERPADEAARLKLGAAFTRNRLRRYWRPRAA